MSGTTFERGDLVPVPFPFSDLSAAKRPPVLILTEPDGYGDFIALPVTSRPQAGRGVALTSADVLRRELPVSSWIRIDRIVTLNASLVIKSIGKVSNEIVAKAVKEFCYRIGAPPAK
jgi:mRNA interferase MazF